MVRESAGREDVLAAKIDDLHRRKRARRHALRQEQSGVAAGARVVPAFDRRGGGAEDDRTVGESCAHDGHVAPVIADAVLLLVRAVVLLVEGGAPAAPVTP